MRRPTDRRAAWSNWERRLKRERVAVTDAPEAGMYQARRGGQWVAVQIDLAQEIDAETGELIADETFVAFVQNHSGGMDRFDDPVRVGEIWQRCAARPITETEFRRILKLAPRVDLTRDVIT